MSRTILYELVTPGQTGPGRHLFLKRVGKEEAMLHPERYDGKWTATGRDGRPVTIRAKWIPDRIIPALKASNVGMLGYEWMVESIIKEGKIEARPSGRPRTITV